MKEKDAPAKRGDQRGQVPEASDQHALTDDELYRSERAQLIKRRDELGDIFDKGRVALAGGAIALSATVIRDLAPAADEGSKQVLIWSWIALTASLILSVVCVYLAGLSHDRQRQILDDDRRVGSGEKRTLKNDRANGFNTWLGWLNPGSVALLLVGLALLGATLQGAFQHTKPKPMLANEVDTGDTMSEETKDRDGRQGGHDKKSFGASDRPVTPKPSQGSQSNPSGQGDSSGTEDSSKKK